MPEQGPSGLWHLKDDEILKAQEFEIKGPKVLRVQVVDATEGKYLLVQVGDRKIELQGHDLTAYIAKSSVSAHHPE